MRVYVYVYVYVYVVLLLWLAGTSHAIKGTTNAACSVELPPPPIQTIKKLTRSYGAVVVDVDLDGLPDVVYVENGRVYVVRQTSPGVFSASVTTVGSFSTGDYRFRNVIVMDVNEDGVEDLFVSGFRSGGKGLYRWFGTTSSPYYTGMTRINGDCETSGQSIRGGDVDGDGDEDVVMICKGYVTVVVNTDGLGGVWSSVTIPGLAPGDPGWSIALLDLDMDGFPESAVGGGLGALVFGIFNVTSPTASMVPLGSAGHLGLFIETGAVSAYGSQDVVYASGTEVSVATFVRDPKQNSVVLASTPQVVFSTTSGFIQSLTLIDLGADGAMDVAVAYGPDVISILANNGAGTLYAQENALSVPSVGRVIAGDVNADGIPDLVAYSDVSLDDYGYYWFDGNPSSSGDGLVVEDSGEAWFPSQQSTGGYIVSLFLDNDAVLDYVHAVSTTVSYAYGDGEGGIQERIILTDSLGVVGLYTGDVNADGHADVVMFGGLRNLHFYVNDGAGVLVFGETLDTSGLGLFALSFALFPDLNLDGVDDMVIAASTFGNPTFVSYALGNGSLSAFALESFIPMDPSKLTWDPVVTGVAGDVDGDGDVDVVLGGSQDPQVLVNGFISPSPSLPLLSFNATPVTSGPLDDVYEITLSDVNDDSFLDLVLVTSGGVIVVTAGVPPGPGMGWIEGMMTSPIGPPEEPGPVAIRGGLSLDANGDGIVDVAIGFDYFLSSTKHYATNLYLGLGNGTFGAGTTVSNSSVYIASREPTLGVDVDGDGDQDLIMGYAFSFPVLVSETRTVFTSYASPTGGAGSVLNLELRLCASHGKAIGVPCLWENVQSLSKCRPRVLDLDLRGRAGHTGSTPAVMGACPQGEHLVLDTDVTLVGPAVFDCSVGRVTQPPGYGVLFLVSGGKTLSLTDVEVKKTGAGFASAVANSGIRVEGADSRLFLSGCVFTECEAPQVVTQFVANGGFGGAVSVVDGYLEANGTRWEGNRAYTGGGGLMVQLGRAVVRHSVFASNTVGGSGGALFVGSLGSVDLDHVDFVDNRAEVLGGAVAVGSGATAFVWKGGMGKGNVVDLGGGGCLGIEGETNPLMEVEGVVMEGNTGQVGGGMAVLTSAGTNKILQVSSLAGLPVMDGGAEVAAHGYGASSGLMVRDVVIRGNTGKGTGGGVLACGVWLRVVGGGNVWEGNVAEATGESGADGVVCGVGPPELLSPDIVFERDGTIPWVWMDGGSKVGLSTARIHGPPGEVRGVVVETPGSGGVIQVGDSAKVAVSMIDVLGSVIVDPAVVVEVSGLDMPGVAYSLPVRVSMTSVGVVSPGVTVFLSSQGLEDFPPVARLGLSSRVETGGGGGGSSVDVGLVPCGVGEGLSVEGSAGSAGVFGCRACEDGFFSSERSMEACIKIPECSDNARRDANGTLCECKAGFFVVSRSPNVGAETCYPCPTGGVCLGGLDDPVPESGFFDVGENTYVRCLRPGACPGGGRRVCAEGYEGYMCGVCSGGYYSDGASRCVKCLDGGGGLLGFAVAGLVVVAVGVGVGLAVMRSGGSGGSGGSGVSGGGKKRVEGMREGMRVRSAPVSLGLVLVAIQYVGLLADVKLSWSSEARGVLNVANVVNLDSNVFASECSLASFHAKYAVSVVLPLALLGLTFLVLLGVSGVKRPFVGVRSGMDKVLFNVAPLVYIPVARSVLILFDCVELPNGEWVVDVDPSVACFDSAWWEVAWVGIVGIVTFVVGIPAYFAVCVVSHRSSLFSPPVFARFGPLYKVYRTSQVYMGVVDIVKRLVVVLVAIFASRSQITQIIALFGVILGSVVYRKSVGGVFFFPLLNRVSFLLDTIVLVVLMVGVTSYAERSNDGSDRFVLVVVIIAMIALMSVGLWAVVTEVRQIRVERRVEGVGERVRWDRLVEWVGGELDDLEEGLAGELGEFIRARASHRERERGEWDEVEVDEIGLDEMGAYCSPVFEDDDDVDEQEEVDEGVEDEGVGMGGGDGRRRRRRRRGEGRRVAPREAAVVAATR